MSRPVRVAKGRPGHTARAGGESAEPAAQSASLAVPVAGLAVPRPDRTTPANPLPPGLRGGIEALSGADLSSVDVHYDSAEPARLDALAYTRGTDIYLGPGQQGHLAHEAWHVVQQQQGRVRPTERVAGIPISADPALEAEASTLAQQTAATAQGAPSPVVQRVIRGLADLTQPQDISDDWVQRYLDDLLDDHTHLYLDEINAYLTEHQPDWLDHCHLENTDGNHWDVVFTDGSTPERVQTMADGSCGAHAISVIQARLAGLPDASNGKRAAAPPQLIQQVRLFARQRLDADHAEVRQRILTEIAEQDFIELTGFGPRLQAALRERQALQAAHQHPGAQQPAKGGAPKGLSQSEQPDQERAELPSIDVWTLLALPVAEIRQLVDGYGLRDRKGLAFALREKFIASFDAALRLPDEVAALCIELLRVTPGPLRAVAAVAAKQPDLPPVWQDLVVTSKKDTAVERLALQEVDIFAAKHGYARPQKPTLGVHELFEHDILTIYPLERKAEEDPFAQYRAKPSKGAEESARKRVHRPILDLEFVGGRFHARCYLGMFAPGTEGRKDVNAAEDGTVQFRDIGLMNLGNPFKALLWCEDYLSSKEHEKFRPDPVVRSFLVPLDSADWLLASGARPLDQDRGSGQFGNYGLPEFDQKLHPLIGSLVSFFLNVEHLPPEPNQVKLPMSALQEHLTGTPGDPREMTVEGVAAQHGRKEHEATFAEPYLTALTAYYDSLSDTGFTDATQKDGVLRTGKWKRDRADVDKVTLSAYPHVLAAFARIRGKGKPTVRWT